MYSSDKPAVTHYVGLPEVQLFGDQAFGRGPRGEIIGGKEVGSHRRDLDLVLQTQQGTQFLGDFKPAGDTAAYHIVQPPELALQKQSHVRRKSCV